MSATKIAKFESRPGKSGEFQLRGYQLRIVETASAINTVVLLPTGAGKTAIAAEAIVRVGKPAVMFVPTIHLVEQQARALRAHPGMPQPVGEFHGDLALPRSFAVLVTTPKAFEMAQARGESTFAWKEFGTVVFDEVHHVLKDHPYRNLALKLQTSGNDDARVIGLTASLTYAVGDAKVFASVTKLCQELNIEKIESAPIAELREGGYQGAGQGTIAEVRLYSDVPRVDVIPRSDRKPHLMHQSFFNRARRSEATQFSQELLLVVGTLEEAVLRVDGKFKSPLDSASLQSWGEYAHRRRSGSPMYAQLEHWYEALRLLVTSWEENDDTAVAFLRMMSADTETSLRCWPSSAKAMAMDFFLRQPTVTGFPRFVNLMTVLKEKIQSRPDFRGILFVQQRLMTHVLEYAINSDPTLQQTIRAGCFYATGSPASPSLGLSKSAGKEVLKAFAAGSSNLLIATNAAEEGMDIPEANSVIYFDPMNTAVSYVQGRGRARQADSSFVMLDQREDRPAELLAQQEQEQHRIASKFVPEKGSNPVAAIEAQQNRERGAAATLAGIDENTAIAKLNLYCKKTKVLIDEIYTKPGDCHTFSLTYSSVLRAVQGTGTGLTKKEAKKRAAVALLQELA